MTEKEFLELELNRWKTSPKRREQITGDKYYKTNNSAGLSDNIYAQMVGQKTGYLFGRPFSLDCEDEEFKREFQKLLSLKLCEKLCENAMNNGVSYLMPYYNETGEFKLKFIKGCDILPFWKDETHTELEMALRLITRDEYDGRRQKKQEYCEVYKPDSIMLYKVDNRKLKYIATRPYFKDADEIAYKWDKIPLVAFRFNSGETPLISRVKNLQDALNQVLGQYHKNVMRDAHSTLLVLKNYDGTDLGEFRRNLSEYGVVKVRTIDGINGDVTTLNVDVDCGNYEALIKLLREAIIRNAKGFDGSDTRLRGTPNQLALKTMYADIDLEANITETEFRSAFDELFWFLKAHLYNTEHKDFIETKNTVVFNRDMLMNESEIMDMLLKCGLKLSNLSLIEQVPWVEDAEREIERLKVYE